MEYQPARVYGNFCLFFFASALIIYWLLFSVENNNNNQRVNVGNTYGSSDVHAHTLTHTRVQMALYWESAVEKGNLFSVFLRLDLKLGWQGISDDDLYRVREGCIQWELVVAKYRPLLDTNTARW